MFFVLLNEDQTQGFFGQSPPSSLFHLEQWGSRDWRTSSTSREEHFFPLLSPSIHFILPLSPTLSLISLSGTQSVSASLSEFIISLRRPWPRWIRALKFFHQREKRLGRPSATKRRKHTKGGSSSVWTGPEGWNVCVHKPVTRQRVRADVRWGLGPD